MPLSPLHLDGGDSPVRIRIDSASTSSSSHSSCSSVGPFSLSPTLRASEGNFGCCGLIIVRFRTTHFKSLPSFPPQHTTAEGTPASTLAWAELGCHVPDHRRKGRELALLQGVCGSARSGDLVAIIGTCMQDPLVSIDRRVYQPNGLSLPPSLGPSGAGKSTLLDLLAQRKTVGRLEGRVTYNGAQISPGRMQKLSAYVLQEVRSRDTRCEQHTHAIAATDQSSTHEIKAL